MFRQSNHWMTFTTASFANVNRKRDASFHIKYDFPLQWASCQENKVFSSYFPKYAKTSLI
uniref:Uncharacterized protein n=1 Tax=Anguilla anguilla TaxID=7936 RepID=A0A0E9P9F2_ANGAN